MAVHEIATARELLFEAVDRVIAASEGLDTEALNWRPLPDASSVSALALHTLGMTEENVMTHICQLRTSARVREAEFAPADVGYESLAVRWRILRDEVDAALDAFPVEQLDALR